jgi:hypothetical protein
MKICSINSEILKTADKKFISLKDLISLIKDPFFHTNAYLEFETYLLSNKLKFQSN